MAEGTPETLGDARPVTTVSFNVPDPGDLPALRDAPDVVGHSVTYRTSDPTALLYTLTGWATGRGMELAGLEVTRPSLEDIYLDIVGEAERTAGAG